MQNFRNVPEIRSYEYLGRPTFICILIFKYCIHPNRDWTMVMCTEVMLESKRIIKILLEISCTEFFDGLTLSFLSIPASHLGLGWPCITIYIIYPKLILTQWLQIYFSSGSVFTQGQGWVAYSSFLNPLLYQGHYLPCGLTLAISAEVTIYPGEWGGGGVQQQIFQPNNFIRVTIATLQPYPPILAEVTIYPAGFTPLFRLVSRQLFT